LVWLESFIANPQFLDNLAQLPSLIPREAHRGPWLSKHPSLLVQLPKRSKKRYVRSISPKVQAAHGVSSSWRSPGRHLTSFRRERVSFGQDDDVHGVVIPGKPILAQAGLGRSAAASKKERSFPHSLPYGNEVTRDLETTALRKAVVAAADRSMLADVGRFYTAVD
jgi:hypothetical protein